NGVRLGHYPQTRSFYNMMGGTLIVGQDYDLGCATDGIGWFNMTGGEVFAKRVMLNERTGGGGYGRLTVAGGTLNLGSLTGSDLAISNGIAVDAGGPYLVELGGAGGTIRAVTNVTVFLDAALNGVGAEAIHFDPAGWEITVSGNLSGDGGLNKTGAGTLTLSGNNTYAGPTRVLQGRLVRGAYAALPDMGEVLFGVTPDDAGGRLHADGDLALEGLVVGVANPEALDKSKHYTIATWGGGLISGFSGSVLPAPWFVYYDWPNKRAQLRAETGTMLWLR
ncbi:MAG TPA: autotransporter-associated beta strand repeat-containing protein, partial [Kiritimatiellia bacterium]|nr:autotransporter-associated beta strand repeat-containing protein [Kiritimatiellia bacterium]